MEYGLMYTFYPLRIYERFYTVAMDVDDLNDICKYLDVVHL